MTVELTEAERENLRENWADEARDYRDRIEEVFPDLAEALADPNQAAVAAFNISWAKEAHACANLAAAAILTGDYDGAEILTAAAEGAWRNMRQFGSSEGC